MKKMSAALRWMRYTLRQGILSGLLLTAILHCDTLSAQQKRVHWALYAFPPYLTLDGGLNAQGAPGDGPAQVFVQHVVDRMSDYTHSFDEGNFHRVIGKMKNGVLACNPLLLKLPEREKFIAFSRPILMALPHFVITKQENINSFDPYLNAQGEVELERLLLSSNLTTSITAERGYPKNISRILERAAAHKNAFLHSADFSTPIRLLLAGRVDYVIAYPFETTSYIQRHAANLSHELEYLSIADTHDFALAHVGCTNNEAGRQIVEQIDQLILAEGPRPYWNDAQFRYLDSNASAQLEALLLRYQPFGQLSEE